MSDSIGVPTEAASIPRVVPPPDCVTIIIANSERTKYSVANLPRVALEDSELCYSLIMDVFRRLDESLARLGDDPDARVR